MDNVVINITELPNNVSFQITEGGGGMQCADLAACQTIIDIESGIDDLQQQIDNLPTTTPNLQQVVTESPIVDGLLAQSLNGLADISITDNYVQVNVNDGTNSAQHTVQATNVTTTVNVTGSVITDGNIEFATPSLTKNGVEIATENFVDNRVQSNIKIVGDWDATSGSYPLADESNTTPFITQWGATIKAGWAFRVGYGQAGTVGGFDYENGDVVYALVDSPTNSSADWGDLDHNLQQATESLRGTGKVITAAIIADETTTDDQRFVTGLKLWQNFLPRILALAHTFAAKITFTTAPRLSSTTANQRLEVDVSKDIISVAKGTADNKNFGTGTTNIPEIGSALGNNKPLITSSSGKLQTSDWVNIVSSCTFVGWGSYTTQEVDVIDMGAYYMLHINVSGTSNSATTTIQLPYTSLSTNNGAGLFANNGTTIIGRWIFNSGSNTITFGVSAISSVWTATGTKSVGIDIFFKK